jgi:LuxR family maltose regulon positive regulatory protein
MAPRVPKNHVARARLRADDEQFDKPIVLVQAPAGFGKTSLLAQWRRENLARGAVVAWLSAGRQDDPSRLVHALALAVRTAAGRPTFGHTLIGAAAPGGLEGVTTWVAEVAQSALDMVLIVDETDRLPPPARAALVYLLRNAPPNLRVVVAARTDCRLEIDDLIDYGQCTLVSSELLRFRLDETIELVHARFKARVDRDAVARLHELTEGWPLGLQLALSVMANGSEPQAEVAAIARHGSALHDHVVDLLLANLDPADVAFLTRIAILDVLHPALCSAVLPDDDAAGRLARMARDTPVFVAGDAGEWLRMHALARDELRRRFGGLPADEQALLHARAADWLAANGFVDAAARHALTAGQSDKAYELAERSLYDALMARGRHGAVLDWLARLPAAELDRRPRLLLAAAWTLALSERHDEASRLVDRILAHPDVDDALRCECALILSGAAVFADDPDRFAALHDPWSRDPPLRDPLLLQVHANRSAFRTLLEGEPALARLRQQQAPHGDHGPALGYIGRWGEFVISLTYLWEGQVLLAENLLRPTLASAEGDLGRRSPFVCMLAGLLAAALWERDQPQQAAALLANRLDVLERSGLPEAVMLGFRTVARIAGADGAEHRALELLGALEAVGVARNLPRLRIASLGDQVRLHSHRFRADTCRDLCERIDGLIAEAAPRHGRLWHRNAALLRDVALGHAAIAAREWRRAVEPLTVGEALARELKMGRLRIELTGLLALALDRCGEKALGRLREAADLARAYGLQRVFVDAHPALGEWARQALGADADAGIGAAPPAAPQRTPPPARDAAKTRSTPSMALTPKEREVLELLARSLSNKEIGLAMQVGEETIKWHVKNLFAKLDAGTRKQVVSRARILGLLETVP